MFTTQPCKHVAEHYFKHLPQINEIKSTIFNYKYNLKLYFYLHQKKNIFGYALSLKTKNVKTF